MFTPPQVKHQAEIDNLFQMEFTDNVEPPQDAVFDNHVDSMTTGQSCQSVPADMREIDINLTATTLITRSCDLLQHNNASSVPPQETGA